MVALAGNGQILSSGSDQDRQCTASAHFTIFRDVRQLYGYGQYSRQIEMEIRAHRETIAQNPKAKETPLAVRSPAEAAPLMRGRIDIGMGHVISLNEKGTIRTMGANDCGQGELTAYESAVQVAAGPYRSAAILSDGRVIMAGLNDEGQGDAQALNRELESTLDPSVRSYSWLQVSCGYTHTAALRSDGRVFAIGTNPDGRCDTRQWREVTQIACGIRHTVARRSDGTCVAVGDNRYGQCNVADWTNVRLVAAGEFHTVALTDTGRVLAVGDNRSGECDLEDLQGIISVACLPEATVCVTAEGRVIIRGNGKLQVDSLENIVAVDTCEYRIAAMTMDGELICIP
jgi:alpha-tubulin suppressor-like RCC1 family protein